MNVLFQILWIALAVLFGAAAWQIVGAGFLRRIPRLRRVVTPAKAPPYRSVKEFIKAKSVAGVAIAAATVFSVQCLDVYPANGAEAQPGIPTHNLTTDTAAGFSNRRDWQASIMGLGSSAAFATANVVASASSATTVTAATATFPTAGNGLAGQTVVVGANASGTGVTVYGRCVANTTTVITVDQWYDGTSTTGAVATTPNATGRIIVLPGGYPAEWMAISSSAVGTSADTVLAGELATNGFARAVGTFAHTHAASTYTLIHLWTCSGGAGTTINSEGQFGGATSAAANAGGGVFPFESSEPTPPSLLSGDTIQNTVTITIN